MIYVSLSIPKSKTYLPCLTGAQKEFTVTDKYCGKKNLTNWGKPCIWLNNRNPLEHPKLEEWARNYLLSNCIFVHLDHRLYMPQPVVPDMFIPPPSIHTPSPQPSLPLSVMEGPSRIPDNRNKGKERMVYLEDLYPDGVVTCRY